MSASQTLSQTRFHVGGMDCGGCAAKIETALARQPGISAVSVSLADGTLAVDHDGRADAMSIAQVVSALGFHPHVLAEAPTAPACGCGGGCGAAAGQSAAALRPWWRRRWPLLACGALLALAQAALWLVPDVPHWVSLPALLVGGAPVARRAWAAARLGSPFSMEMLMTVAALGALVLGAWDEAAMVVFLFLLGEALEGLAAARAQAGIRALGGLLPKTALRRQGDDWVEVAADSLRPGDLVLVRPGDRLAVDGTVVEGEGGFDEAAVSGESVPVRKRPGDTVRAGTIGQDGVLTVRADSDARDNTITRIARLVQQAQQSKAPFARFVDRFARRYTPAVVAVAALVMVAPPLVAGQDWQTWIYRGLALLLIGCPCALVISTPAAIAAALAAAARQGVLLKGGDVLEKLAQVDMVAFDKTGTLTLGRPQVTDVVGTDGDARAWLAVAAGLAAGSTHPLAQAVAAHAAASGLAPAAVEDGHAVAGRGIGGRWNGQPVFLGADDGSDAAARLWAQGKTVTCLRVGDRPVLVVGLRDGLRADARPGVEALRRLGLSAAMLSGDRRPAAEAVAAPLALPVHAPLAPQDKLDLIRGWQRDGHVVAKVGDGINDAPALAAADVGMAMGGGADMALEAADAALLHGRVGDVAAAVALARRSLGVIRQNVALALGLKAVFLVTTLVGLTGLWPAVLADTGATVLVTANALRLLRVSPRPE